MNEETRKKYQLLKEKNKMKVRELKWKGNILFTECITSLHGCEIVSLEQSDVLFEQMKDTFSMTNYGHINWKKEQNFVTLEDISDIYKVCNLSKEYYIIWDQKDIPCVSCQLATILAYLDDVLAVAFDTWLLSKDKKEVIEFYHEGKIVLGKIVE